GPPPGKPPGRLLTVRAAEPALTWPAAVGTLAFSTSASPLPYKIGMTLALLSLFVVGLLAPAYLPPSRRGPQENGAILVGGGPCLLADWTPDDPPLPDPARQTRPRPRAYLEDEPSPDDL